MASYKSLAAVAVILGTWTALPQPALSQSQPSEVAQNSQGDGVQDIVVTAQRRAERLQDVPIAVNVIGGAQLATKGIVDTQSIAVAVPGMDFAQQGSGAGIVYLRGVGSNDANPNGEPSVATYIDGVYIASPTANIFDLDNVERIEVLKGPQGTLFGRNATGGVIQIITRDPSYDTSLSAKVGYGNFDTIKASGYATTGLGSKVATDLSAQYINQRDGWGTNVTTGKDVYLSKSFTVRSKTLFQPDDNTNIRVAADYGRISGDTVSYRVGGLRLDGTPPPVGKYDSSGDVGLHGYHNGYIRNTQGGGSVNIQHGFGDLQFVSISSYRQVHGLYVLDEDTVLPQIVSAYLPSRQWNISQEFQLQSTSGPVKWTVGAFGFYSKACYCEAELAGAAFGPTETVITGRQRNESGSVYGQFDAPIDDRTKVTGGLRFTDEHTAYHADVDGAVANPGGTRKQFKKFTWRLAIDHEFSNEIHGYLSYNRGIKGGGFDVLTPSSAGFNPEVLDAYEAGLKSKLFDNHVRLNLSAFYYGYKDIQVQVIPQGSVVTNNAARATIKGFDADFQIVPVRNFTISGGFAYLQGHYDKFPDAIGYPASALDGPSFVFDASGQDTIRTPKFTGNVGADYVVKSAIGDFTLSSTVSYNDGYFYDSANRLKQPSYTLVSASLNWESSSKTFSASLWGRNLANQYYYNQGVPSGVGDLLTPAAPRTYGITVGVKF